MARRLKLIKKELADVEYLSLGAFRLRVECSDPSDSGADPHVFLYNLRPVNPYTGASDSDFMAIASPGDLAEYPVGEPRTGTAYPFFRLDYVELDFRASSQAAEVWTAIVLEVGALLTALDRMDVLVPVAEVWIGSTPDTGVSDSASESSSNSNSSSQ